MYKLKLEGLNWSFPFFFNSNNCFCFLDFFFNHSLQLYFSQLIFNLTSYYFSILRMCHSMLSESNSFCFRVAWGVRVRLRASRLVPTVHWISCKPSKQVRYCGSDRHAHMSRICFFYWLPCVHFRKLTDWLTASSSFLPLFTWFNF